MATIPELERKLMLQAESELARRRLEERGLMRDAELAIREPTDMAVATDVGPLNDQTPLDWLPPPVATWVAEVSRVYQVPRVLPIAGALTAAAAVLQGRVRVRVAPGWEEPLSLYWLVASPTGTRKSTVLRRAVRALEYWQAELAAQVEEQARGKRHRLKRLDAQLSMMRRSKTDPMSEGYNRHEQRLKELESERDSIQIPVAESLLHGDINPPLIPRLMAHNFKASGIERMAVLQAEGTFLRNLMGRWGAGSSQLELVLAASSGEPYSVVRSNSDAENGFDEVQLRSPHLTMGLLVQPELFDALGKYASSSNLGLIGRCIMTEVDEPPRKPLFGESVPDEVQAAYDEWLLGLCQLWVSDDPNDVASGAQPSVVKLPAVGSWKNWMTAVYDKLPCDGKGINNRVLGIMCRIAVVAGIGVHGGGGGVERVLASSQKILDLIYFNNLRSYEELDRPATGTARSLTARLLGTLRGYAGITAVGQKPTKLQVKVDVRQFNKSFRHVTADAFYESLEQLENQGWIEWDERSLRRYKGTSRYRSFTIVRLPEEGRQPGED